MKVMTLLKRKGVSVKMVLSWKRSSRSTAIWKIMKERARSARTDKYRTRAAATSFGRDSTDSTAIAMMAPSTGVSMTPTAALLPGERLAFYAGPGPSPKLSLGCQGGRRNRNAPELPSRHSRLSHARSSKGGVSQEPPVAEGHGREPLDADPLWADSWAHHEAVSEIPVKMEYEFEATASDVVGDVRVVAGQAVNVGFLLVPLGPEPA